MTDVQTTLSRTPLHHWHQAHGARFVDRDGWQVVAAYSGAEAEATAARAGLGMADVSAFAKVSVRGPALRTALPFPRGGLFISDKSWLGCKLTDDHALLLASVTVAPGVSQGLADSQTRPGSLGTDVTSTYAGFELVGPALEEVLRSLTHHDTRPPAGSPGSCAETALAGVEALLVRHDRGALPALRVYVAWDLGEYVWERLLEAGADVPLTLLGLEASGVASAPRG
jgi:sarcosine oxidase subunit alpha